MTLYFAYGSNMWEEQMRHRCPASVKRGHGVLSGYRWIIYERGYANIVPDADSEVHGTVYTLEPEDEIVLDRAEGVHLQQYAKERLPVRMGEQTVECLVYQDPVTVEGPPKTEYVDRMRNGIRDANLPADYVRNVLEPFLRFPGSSS